MRRLRALILLTLVSAAHAQEARLCVGRLVVEASKQDATPWDGPGAGAHTAGKLLHLAAETAEEEALVHAAPVVAQVIDGATAAPDLRLTLTRDRRPPITTAVREDTTTATWDPLCITGPRAELQSLAIEVTDEDLSEHDQVGILKLSAGLPMVARTWQAGPFGRVKSLELTYTPLQTVTDLRQGLVHLPAGHTTHLDLVAPGPGVLLLAWTVAGRKAGIEGAHDDQLIGYSLLTPDGRLLDELGKHTEAERRISIREGGTYQVHYSNRGFLRSSAREVSFKFRWEGASAPPQAAPRAGIDGHAPATPRLE